MTANDGFERDLQAWLAGMASPTAPAGLHDAVIDRARGSRQRPRWAVAVRGGSFGGSLGINALPGVRVASVLVILAVVLATIVAAFVGGLFRSAPPTLGGNGAIAYSIQDVSQRNRPSVVHLIDQAGTDRSVAFGSCPRFSTDGTVLSYGLGRLSSTQIHISRPDGSAPRLVAGIGESEYALSPDGTRIAWVKLLDRIDTFPQTELWVGPVSGGPGIRVIPAPVDPDAVYSSPTWSPDGRRIAVAVSVLVSSAAYGGSYRREIDVVDEDGSNLRPLTRRPGTGVIGLTWSPDGQSMAYLGLPDGASPPSLGAPGDPADSFEQPLDIFVILADGSGDRSLTSTTAAESDPAWSPDGTHLGYVRIDGDGVGHVTTIRMDGSVGPGPPNLGPTAQFAWSPDGTALLLVDGEDGVIGDASLDSQPAVHRIQTVDAEFRRPPVTLQVVDHALSCMPSWQRLEP